MMAGNPNWWSMNINGGMHPPDYHLQFPPNSSNPSLISDHHHPAAQDFPVRSWSQFLLGGGEERLYGANLFQQQKKLENWEEQVLLNLNPACSNNFAVRVSADHVKQEIAPRQPAYGDDEFQAVRYSAASSNCWPAPAPAPVISSPTSCVTNSILNFSSSANNNKSAAKPHPRHHSSECNSSSTTRGGVTKKARVQQSSAQPALKVRKEKLGDRITALHQLVSPFGKTDTASVLSEAIGYIRFLQGQIEALSSPYMRNASTGHHHQHSFLNDVGMERTAPKQDSSEGQTSDLRSRGLCLVPISCTQHMANDTAAGGADYWAPAALGGGF